MAKSKVKYLPAPDTSSPDMNTFAGDPWITGRCGHWGKFAVEDLPPVPAWVSPAGLARLQYLQEKGDPDGNAAFFRQLCALPHAQTPPGRLTLVGMMACMGWSEMVDDLIKDGAPISLALPQEEWEWVKAIGPATILKPEIGIEQKDKLYRIDALALAVASSIPDTAAAPLHPGRAASLELIVAAGGEVDAIPGSVVRALVESGKIGRLMVRLGLKASAPAQGEQTFLDRLLSPDTELAQNQRNLLLAQLIGSGMPAHPPGCKPLMEYISASVFGINALKVAITHPDRQGIDAQVLEYEDALRSRARSRRTTPTPEEIERVELVDKLVASARMSVATPQVESPSSAARPRI